MVIRLFFALVACGLVAGHALAKPRDYLKKSDSWFAQPQAKSIAENILSFQSETGGWPKNQDTTSKGYARHITFNDGAMVRLLDFLREVATSTTYEFVDGARRLAAAKSVDIGIECILKCQIVIDGKRTVWCAQHDEIDFRPQSARSYELATFSGSESVGITRFLMSLENPSEEIVESVDAAIEWFNQAAIKGIRVETQTDPEGPKGVNRVVIQDESAPPLWARFYDLRTQAPVFVDRDGVPRRSLSEIGYERRNGYAWYGNWPQKLLSGEYRKWKLNLK
jgi:PelA/Pel-15E family pectate lyase